MFHTFLLSRYKAMMGVWIAEKMGGEDINILSGLVTQVKKTCRMQTQVEKTAPMSRVLLRTRPGCGDSTGTKQFFLPGAAFRIAGRAAVASNEIWLLFGGYCYF